MLTNSIDPTLFTLFGFEIRYYGIIYVIGFILLWWFLNKKRQELNLEKKDIEDFILYSIIGVIVGARLFEILWSPSYYLSNPTAIFKVWNGGMSLHGGIIGIILAGLYFSKKKNISFLKLADLAVIPAVFGLALGRIGNFINSELVGTVTSLPWCVNFKEYLGCRHPVQLYGAAGRFALFGLLLYFYKSKEKYHAHSIIKSKFHNSIHQQALRGDAPSGNAASSFSKSRILKMLCAYEFKDGFLFWNFIFFMGLGRFFIDFLREDSRFFGLSLGQYFSLIMVVVGIYVLLKHYKKNLNTLFDI